jgi:uncharacterized protein (DUF342 family)
MLDSVESVLLEAGIKAGVLTVPEPMDDHWIVARGVEPAAGTNGSIEMQELGGRESGGVRLKSGDMAAVDPRDMNLLVNARKGDCIAKKIPPTKGVSGRNVFGEEIPARPGKWVAFHPGEGVEIVDREMNLKATVSGKVHVEGDVISVLDEWELDDVDISTGHVKFFGRLLRVKGSVLGGLKVSVEGDLVIEGNIEDDTAVKAGGNIDVKGLIRAGNTVVSAGANLNCSSVEYAEVNAMGDINVRDYMLDAVCRAGRDVTVSQGKGLVAGGKVFLGGSFSGNVIGTQANVPTMIHAGFNPQIKEIHDNCVEELEDYAKKRAELQNALEKIEMVERTRGGLSEKISALKQEIQKGLANIVRATAEKQKMVGELEARLGTLRSATIKVRCKVYPNSIIRISNARLVLKKEVEAVIFRFKGGQVVLSTIL